MIHSYTRVGDDTLRMQGSPDELYGEDNELGFTDVVAGLTVAKVSTNGKHDGHPATIIHLADDMGDRELGRLVLRHDVDFKEEIFEWERLFPIPDALEDFVAAHEAAVSSPTVAVTQDLCWDGFNSAEHAMADTAARFGVSVTPTGVPSGNPWPEVRIFGLRDNVRRCLKQGWQMTDEDVAYALEHDKA